MAGRGDNLGPSDTGRRLLRRLALALLAAVGPSSTALAQTDSTRWVVRPWFTFDVGFGTQTRDCPGCTAVIPLTRENAPTALGPTTALAAGVTLTRAIAVGAGLAHRFPYRESVAARVALDYQHTVSGRYPGAPHLQRPSVGVYRARMFTLAVGASGLFLPRP